MSEVAATAPAPGTPNDNWRPAPRPPWLVVAVALIAFAAVFAVLAAWSLPPFDRGLQSTDNAYVKGRVTVIAPQVTGYVSAVLVKSFDKVQKGQVLVRIDDGIYQARVAQARAGVEAARAAGMRTLGFAGGLTPAAWLEGPGTTVFTDMAELPGLVDASP